MTISCATRSRGVDVEIHRCTGLVDRAFFAGTAALAIVVKSRRASSRKGVTCACYQVPTVFFIFSVDFRLSVNARVGCLAAVRLLSRFTARTS